MKGKHVNKNLASTRSNSDGQWEAAIERAKYLIQENKIRMAKLRAAVRIFQERRAAGERWPGQRVKQGQAF